MTLTTSMVYANTTIITASNKSPKEFSFTKDWKNKITKSKNGYNDLIYGFDKGLIKKEDFASADSTGYRHMSKIINDKGTFTGPKKNANDDASDLRVAHKGSTVKYYCIGVK